MVCELPCYKAPAIKRYSHEILHCELIEQSYYSRRIYRDMAICPAEAQDRLEAKMIKSSQITIREETSKTRPLRPRQQLRDIANPSFQDLFTLAVLRICDIVRCQPEAPPRLFPMAETTYSTFFTDDDWEDFGDMETEYGRMSYTLSRLPTRGFPAACAPQLEWLLCQRRILCNWDSVVSELGTHTEATLLEVVGKMQTASPKVDEKTQKADFITVPVDYDINPATSAISLRLWSRSLSEISSQLAQAPLTQGREFLQIYAFLKDPIGGLAKPFERQLGLFHSLLNAFRVLHHASQSLFSPDTWARVVAQAAQESSYLATLHLERVAYVHFHAHQQLPYAYVALESLARSEFSHARHVLDIVKEILQSAPLQEGLCPIAPIAVARYPALLPRAMAGLGGTKMTKKKTKKQHSQLSVILDGNHRAMAVTLLRFLATQPQALLMTGEMAANKGALREYCLSHGLEIKWQVDLMEVLDELYSSRGQYCLELLVLRQELLARFARVTHIPALLVQEESFHTVCQQRAPVGSKPRVLLPMFQAIFNDASLGFAFPQAGQVHGRAAGFKPMPLILFD